MEKFFWLAVKIEELMERSTNNITQDMKEVHPGGQGCMILLIVVTSTGIPLLPMLLLALLPLGEIWALAYLAYGLLYVFWARDKIKGGQNE